jgi:sporulation protein YlmC with PRC-barrel domain
VPIHEETISMKHTSVIFAAALLALPGLSVSALATDGNLSFVPAQTANQYLAKDHLIGAKVAGQDGKIIGDVEDLIVNDQNQIVGVVLGTGGFLGVAEKKVAVDLSALKFDEKDGKTTVSLPGATQAVIDTAPTFQRTQPAKSLLERAREKAVELGDKTTATTKKAIDDAKPVIDDAKVKAQEAYDKAKEAATPAYEKAKEAVGTAYDEAKKAVSSDPAATPPAEPAPTTEPAPAAPATPPAEPKP